MPKLLKMKQSRRVEDELQRRLLISARASFLAAPLGAGLVFYFLGGQLRSSPQVVWACLAATTGLVLTLLCHVLVKRQTRISPTLLRTLLLINPAVAQAFLFVFHPNTMSREAMLEALIGAMICISQMVSFSADRIAARGVAIISLTSMSLAAASLLHFPMLVRVLATLPVALTFLQTSEMLHRQQRKNIELRIENEDLIQELRSANALLAVEVKQDPLTGLMNRTGLYDALERSRPVGVLYIDVDAFKLVNDTHGHAVGDHVLQKVGEAIRKVTRPNDVVARIGGDEFVVLLDGSDDEATHEVGNRICSEVRTLLAATSVTVSVGAASGDTGMESPDELLARADRGLYSAKHSGGNRLEMAA
jgi:diguanylate cyclase (GGDEF)-like protein